MPLLHLLNTRWEELEADFQEVYGLELSDFWMGALSARRAWVLITQLKPGSRVHRAQGGVGAWSEAEAAIHLQGNRLADVLCAVNGVKESKRPKPVEPPEEGWQDKARENESKAQRKMENWLKRHPEVSS